MALAALNLHPRPIFPIRLPSMVAIAHEAKSSPSGLPA
jgi:hypothetical protein